MVTGRRARGRHVCGLITLTCGALLCVSLTQARPVHAATTASSIALAFFDGDRGDYSGLAHLDRDHITHLAPSGLYLAADGGLHEVGDPNTLARLAHASDVKVFPMVQNYRDGAVQGGDLKLLASASARQTLVTEVVQAVIDAGGDGVNLDFEQMSPTLTMPFVSFVAELYSRLHAAGKGMIVDIPVDHRSYDVPRLQGITDWLLLMAYDQHNLPGRPGPIAAYPWVQAALQQLRQEAAPGKVLLGSRATATTGDGALSSRFPSARSCSEQAARASSSGTRPRASPGTPTRPLITHATRSGSATQRACSR